MIAEGLLKITAQVNPRYFENSIVALVGTLGKAFGVNGGL